MAKPIFSKADSLQLHKSVSRYGQFRGSFQKIFRTATEQTNQFWTTVSKASNFTLKYQIWANLGVNFELTWVFENFSWQNVELDILLKWLFSNKIVAQNNILFIFVLVNVSQTIINSIYMWSYFRIEVSIKINSVIVRSFRESRQ